jgi:Oxidative-stress-responsive kinase 1 C-terminal domain
VDFDFDLGADTAMSVASEMVEDLSLSAEDARAVAAAIRDEIKLLTGLLHRHGNDSLASSSNGVRPAPLAKVRLFVQS